MWKFAIPLPIDLSIRDVGFRHCDQTVRQKQLAILKIGEVYPASFPGARSPRCSKRGATDRATHFVVLQTLECNCRHATLCSTMSCDSDAVSDHRGERDAEGLRCHRIIHSGVPRQPQI
jgi:hypothetical protein